MISLDAWSKSGYIKWSIQQYSTDSTSLPVSNIGMSKVTGNGITESFYKSMLLSVPVYTHLKISIYVLSKTDFIYDLILL